LTAFAAATDVIFGDPNLSEAAIWRPGGTGNIPVRIVRRRPDAIVEFGSSRALMPTVIIDVRGIEAAIIDEGDHVVVGTETFKIVGTPAADPLGLVLSCEAVKV
jgi:hypothetical protein